MYMDGEGVSDLGSGVHVDTLVLMVALTGLNHSGRGQIFRIRAQLHPAKRRPRVEVRSLVHALPLIRRVQTVGTNVRIIDS